MKNDDLKRLERRVRALEERVQRDAGFFQDFWESFDLRYADAVADEHELAGDTMFFVPIDLYAPMEVQRVSVIAHSGSSTVGRQLEIGIYKPQMERGGTKVGMLSQAGGARLALIERIAVVSELGTAFSTIHADLQRPLLIRPGDHPMLGIKPVEGNNHFVLQPTIPAAGWPRSSLSAPAVTGEGLLEAASALGYPSSLSFPYIALRSALGVRLRGVPGVD